MKKFTEFNLQMNTEIVFGRGAEKKTAELIGKYGGGKVMMVYGGGSIKGSGLYRTLTAELEKEGIPFIELSGVQPNPRRSFAEKGLLTARKEGVDFLLGIGGGSSIDTAKAIALGLANDGDFFRFFRGEAPLKMAPVGAVPTISAAGSETSGSSVMVDDVETHMKYSIMYHTARPVFAVMNPELTYTVPVYQKASGIVDILSHVFIRYFTDADCYLGDQYCEGTMRTVVKYGPVACASPTDYEAHAEVMLTASFAHNDVLNLGRYTKNRGGEHALERQLSGFYDTPHGAGLAVVMPAWLQFITDNGNQEQAARVAQFGEKVFDVSPDSADIKGVAVEGIRRFRAWIKSMGMPLTLTELGVPKSDLNDVINRCVENNHGLVPGYLPLNRSAVTKIFTSVAE